MYIEYEANIGFYTIMLSDSATEKYLEDYSGDYNDHNLVIDFMNELYFSNEYSIYLDRYEYEGLANITLYFDLGDMIDSDKYDFEIIEEIIFNATESPISIKLTKDIGYCRLC